jgi:hypothetical protein
MNPSRGTEGSVRAGALRWSLPVLSGSVTAFPATAAQMGLWLAHELSDRPEGFIVRVVDRIEGPLDIARLEAAFNAVVDRHEMLRSTFALAGDTLMVNTFEFGPISLVNQALPAEERDLQCHFASALHHRWSLLGDPMLRLIIGQVAETTHILGIFVHHAVVDSESLGLVMQDLSEAFNGEGPRSPTGRYGALHLEQDDLRKDPEHERALEQWQEILRSAPSLSRPRSLEASSAGGEIELLERRLSPEETAALQRAAVRYGTTTFVVMFARLALAVTSAIGRPDVIIGTAVSMRFAPEWERVVGLFADFAPVRVCCTGEPLVLGGAVEQVRRQLRLALSYPSIGFAEIVAAVNPQRSTDDRPLFQVYATQERPEAMCLRLSGLDTTLLEVPALQYPADIGFELMLGQPPTVRCMWDASRHSPLTIQTLVGGLLAQEGGWDGL